MKNRVATTGTAIAMLWMTIGQAAPPPAGPPSSTPATQPESAETAKTGLLAREKATSKERMRQIYNAIQAYRKDHQELPDYLSDLYPHYIAETNVFLCPAMQPGEELSFPGLHDPKLLVQFGYEFNVHPIQAMFGYTGPMTMRAWKRMQMSVVGGVVPILRCFAFEQVINVGFDGQVYESSVDWEENFADMVKPGELEPRHLRLLMMKNLGAGFSGEALAFEQLQEAVSSNNKGVVVSDKPLSDTSKLKGKVVLIDFWATWCGPCVAEVPHVKEAYDKFHDKGFEVVGISFDSDKGALKKFVKSKGLPWPQYFDGKGWQNQFGKEYGIEAIPTMWLLNREGKVVDTNARSDLAGKVGRLIAQN